MKAAIVDTHGVLKRDTLALWLKEYIFCLVCFGPNWLSSAALQVRKEKVERIMDVFTVVAVVVVVVVPL